MSSASGVFARRLAVLCLALGAPLGVASAGEHRPFPLNPTYQEECGGCHVPYPPALLPGASWRLLMGGLDRHFGSDASLTAPVTQALTAYLVANGGRDAEAGARPPLRITETAYFKRKHRDGHDGLSAAVWRSAAVKTPANCAACHGQAAQGDYHEHGLRVPPSK